ALRSFGPSIRAICAAARDSQNRSPSRPPIRCRDRADGTAPNRPSCKAEFSGARSRARASAHRSTSHHLLSSSRRGTRSHKNGPDETRQCDIAEQGTSPDIGGLITSTALTLLVLPSLYAWVERRGGGRVV